MGGGGEGDVLAGVVKDILDHPVRQALLVHLLRGAELQRLQHMGQQHVQIAQAGGKVFIAGVLHQLVDGVERVLGHLAGPQHRLHRQHGVEGVGELGDAVRQEEGGEALDIRAQLLEAVGHQREVQRHVAGLEQVAFPVDLHHAFALHHVGDLQHLVDVQRKGIARHFADEDRPLAGLIESFHQSHLHKRQLLSLIL